MRAAQNSGGQGSGLNRSWRPGGPVDVAATMSVHHRGRHDPAHRVTDDGAVWQTCQTPSGAATLRLIATASTGTAEARAWGPGAPWVLDTVPQWLGAEDDPSELLPRHEVVRWAILRNPGLRIGRTGLVMDALVPAVLEQKVTGAEAWRGWRRLLLTHGEPAPGPAPAGMRVRPPDDQLAVLPSWEWHRVGVGPQRARTVVRAARVAARLAEAATMSTAEATTRLQAVPGVGVWTAAEVCQRVLGDPDVVSVGDHGLPRLVAYALTGERHADDARMLELLEPYEGQRYRVCRLLERSAMMPPRRAPRAPVRDYRSI